MPRVIHDFQQFKIPGISWVDVKSGNGEVLIENERKVLRNWAGLINTHGSYKVKPFAQADSRIWQVEIDLPESLTAGIALATIHESSGLQSSGGIAILLNSFLAAQNIRMNGKNENQVPGGTPVASLTFPGKYTLKFERISGEKIKGYVTTPSVTNHLLGEVDFGTNDIYFSLQQTFVDPSSSETQWDNFFIHDEGLSFDGSNFMSYADVDDVVAEFPSLVFAATTDKGITQDEVTEWLDQISADIDSEISNRYETPVTNADEALKVLKSICIKLAVARIKRKLFVSSGSKRTSQLLEAKDLEAQCEKKLLRIQEGKKVLIGAAASGGIPASESYGRSNQKTPTFEKETKQW